MVIEKIKKLILINISFVVAFVVLFSPGFVGLRISDANVIRAALALTLGITMPIGMFVCNYSILAQKKEHRFLESTKYSATDICNELAGYQSSKLFGKVSLSAIEQIQKCNQLDGKINEILSRKFDRGSLTYQKFTGVTEEVKTAVFENTIGMLNRMRVMDDAEYAKLQNYQNDDIPDDIQIQRLELYNKNIQAVKEQRNHNEKILYKLDELMLELASSEVTDITQLQNFAEMDNLIKQIKFYQ